MTKPKRINANYDDVPKYDRNSHSHIRLRPSDREELENIKATYESLHGKVPSSVIVFRYALRKLSQHLNGLEGNALDYELSKMVSYALEGR